MRRRGRALGVAVLLAGFPTLLSAQGLTLDDIEARTAEARLDEARLGLELWWESAGDWEGRDLERALWLRARLTVDPEMAAHDYRRIASEFPDGTYASRARRRLDQLAQATGERPVEAARPPLYTLELGSSDSYARAARLFDRAVREGLNPRMVVLRSDATQRYRIRVGRFSDREDARRLVRRLERRDFEPRVRDDARQEEVARRR